MPAVRGVRSCAAPRCVKPIGIRSRCCSIVSYKYTHTINKDLSKIKSPLDLIIGDSYAE